jgi:peptidoglycan/LPS O-acetylase OafA/YrhL
MTGPPDAGPRPAAGRFLAGDPLRGLAAFGVAIYHAATVSLFVAGHFGDLAQGWPVPFGPLAGGVIGAAANSVGVFFVLSGYLISRPFVAAFADSRALPPVLAYLRNRALRIVPAYWAALALVIVVAGAQGRTWADAPRLIGFSEDWANSPVRFDLGQTWTLDIEVRYYLAVPAIAGLLFLLARLVRGRPRRRSTRLWLVGSLALVGAGICFVVFPRATQQQAWTIGAQAHLLLLGVVLATAELGGTWRWLGTPAGRRVGLAAFALSPMALVWMQYAGSPLLSLGGLDFARSTSLIAAVAALAIVGAPVLLQRAGAGCWRFLDNAPLRWLGARSYGFYLYQLGVLTELSYRAPEPGRFHRTFVFLVVAGIPIILVLAALSWRLVEKPALRWKASRPKPDPSPPGSSPAPVPVRDIHLAPDRALAAGDG